MVLCLTGCVKEQMDNAGNHEVKYTPMTFTAGINSENPDTKVAYEETADGLKLTWNSDDAITVFFVGDDFKTVVGEPQKFTINSINTDGTADFTGSIPTGAKYFACVYPYKATTDVTPTSGAAYKKISYEMNEQTGDYDDTKTVMRTKKFTSVSEITNNTTLAPVIFDHWTYIINATLDFGSTEGTITDILFRNTNIVRTRQFRISASATEDAPWAAASSTKGEITVTNSVTLVNGKANVKIYGFGDNKIGDIKFSCTANNQLYAGELKRRLIDGEEKNCANGNQYNATFNMKPDENTLVFDFRSKPGDDWPTSGERAHVEGGTKCTYTLNGKNYNFILADATDATKDQVYYNSANKLTTNAIHRYIGLPAIEGKKLVKIECTSAQNSTTKAPRNVGITSKLYATSDYSDNVQYVNKEGEIAIKKENTKYTFNLVDSKSNTVYYMYGPSASGFGVYDITLFYEDAIEPTGTVLKIGSYNIRSSRVDLEDENNKWEARKSRLVTSITDNAFDIFAVQECTYESKTYLENELGSTYSSKFFNPYSSNGELGSGTNVGQGIFWKTSDFTMDEDSWHYFWPSETPDQMTTNDTYESQSYNRGAFCCIFTHKESNLKFFVMGTHGHLNGDSRVAFASVYETKEKLYNPNGYPSFFIGDMNARPSDESSKTYRTYWSDPYLTLPTSSISGPEGTFNGFGTADRRIDYVYYRGKVTPLNYGCNDAKYNSLFASDHYPIYLNANIHE